MGSSIKSVTLQREGSILHAYCMHTIRDYVATMRDDIGVITDSSETIYGS